MTTADNTGAIAETATEDAGLQLAARLDARLTPNTSAAVLGTLDALLDAELRPGRRAMFAAIERAGIRSVDDLLTLLRTHSHRSVIAALGAASGRYPHLTDDLLVRTIGLVRVRPEDERRV